jgi:hypothetical protein
MSSRADSENSIAAPAGLARRAFVTALAGGAAAAIVAPAAALASGEPDPIFAAIDRHRRAYQDYFDNLGEDEVEEAVPQERRASCLVDALFGQPDWQVPGDDPRWIAHIETACRTSKEQEEAALALVSSENLSVAGATALLRYAVELEAKDSMCWPNDVCDDDGDNKRRSFQFFLMKQVAEALGNLAVQS